MERQKKTRTQALKRAQTPFCEGAQAWVNARVAAGVHRHHGPALRATHGNIWRLDDHARIRSWLFCSQAKAVFNAGKPADQESNTNVSVVSWMSDMSGEGRMPSINHRKLVFKFLFFSRA